MPDVGAILDRLDRIRAELDAIQAEVVALTSTAAANGVDDLADINLIDTHSAAARFNRPVDTIRFWCRQQDCGIKIGGVWMASVPRIRRRLKRE